MRIQKVLAMLLAMLVLVSCAQMPAEQVAESEYEGYIDVVLLSQEIPDEAAPLAANPVAAEAAALSATTPAPATSADPVAVQTAVIPVAVASGTKTKKVAKAVIRGDWGNGTDRKERLTAAGYDYHEVQTLVNKMLKK